MRVQLTWIDPNTQQVRSPTLRTPIAFGREFGEMPAAMKNKAVSRMVLTSDQIAPFHAILAESQSGLAIMNRADDKQTLVNGNAANIQPVQAGDRITIGPFEITVAILSSQSSPAQQDPFAGMAPASNSDSLSASSSAPVSQTHSSPAPTQAAGTAAGMAAGGMVMGLAEGANGNAAGFFGPEGTCTRKVGFLFKRKCDRTTTVGCPDCQNGQIDPNQGYQEDYAYYPGYGRYDRGYWGHDYYCHRHSYYYDPHSRDVDFNESDAASFVEEGDRDYEMDLDAS